MERAETAVRALLAPHWEVDPAALVLEWGEAAVLAIPGSFAVVELLGSGGKGHWVVAFDDPGPGGTRAQVVLRAGVLVPLPVATRALDRGQVLEAGDIRYETALHWGDPRGREVGAEVGWVARRALLPDEPLERPAVTPPKVVHSGRPVEIVWERGALCVTVLGRAAGTAEVGESVYVRTDTGRRLRGIALGPGRVRISDTSLERMR
jgi:flagella basal body P-ring formation protein FlgA